MMVEQPNVFGSTEITDAVQRGPEYFDQSRGILEVNESEDLSRTNMNQSLGLTWPGGLADKIGKVQILPQVTHRSEYIFHSPLGFSGEFSPGGLCKLQVPQQCDDFCQGRTRLIDVSLFCKKEVLEQQQRYEEQAPDLLCQSMPKKTLLNTSSPQNMVQAQNTPTFQGVTLNGTILPVDEFFIFDKMEEMQAARKNLNLSSHSSSAMKVGGGRRSTSSSPSSSGGKKKARVGAGKTCSSIMAPPHVQKAWKNDEDEYMEYA